MNIIAVLMGLGHADSSSVRSRVAAQVSDVIVDQQKNEKKAKGIDPETMTMSIKLSSLNMKADERMFSDHLRILMRDVDLSFDQAHGYARIAYNEVRDKLDLSGEDVSYMNSSIEVLSTIKAIKNGAIELSDLFESVCVEPGDTVQNPNGDELPKSAASQGLFSSQSEIQRGVRAAVLGMAVDKRNQI